MDDEPQVEGEVRSESNLDENSSPRDQFKGAFFPQAQNFVVAGGNFTNVTQAAPELPADFRRIPRGDIDLRKEIRLDYGSGTAYRRSKSSLARRIHYSARIYGSDSSMTVAVYQGKNAEQEWRQNISRYSQFCHPNLVQIFAVAKSSGTHAAIFHDDLIPAPHLMEKYKGSHLRTVLLWHVLNSEFSDAQQYIQDVLGIYVYSLNCLLWIRPSTGRLCVDPMTRPYDELHTYAFRQDSVLPASTPSVLEPPTDLMIVDSISLDNYHHICTFNLEQHYRQLSIPANASIQLGAVLLWPPGSEIEPYTEIASNPSLKPTNRGWQAGNKTLLLLDNGWSRVESSDVSHYIYWIVSKDPVSLPHHWLAQANHIFHVLGITSNQDDYVLVDRIKYQLLISKKNSILLGYLFLCPSADFESDIPSRLQLPECPAYWSLDPTGVERLSTAEAEELGFPSFEVQLNSRGLSWDTSVYSGIHEFHELKGFDSHSQDVARELGYPLYQVSSESGACSYSENGDGDDDRTTIRSKSPQAVPDELVLAQEEQKISCSAANTDDTQPSKGWKILITMQLTLILALALFLLCGYYVV